MSIFTLSTPKSTSGNRYGVQGRVGSISVMGHSPVRSSGEEHGNTPKLWGAGH